MEVRGLEKPLTSTLRTSPRRTPADGDDRFRRVPANLRPRASTPATTLHIVLHATLLPIYAVGVGLLAWRGFGQVANRASCVLGVVGGIALTVVGPLLLLTDNPDLGRVFMPGAGTFIFLIAVGVRLVSDSRRDATAAVA